METNVEWHLESDIDRLNNAVSFQNFTVMFALLKIVYPNQVDMFGRSPLSIAAQQNNTRMMLHLIEYGADVDYSGGVGCETPLMIACKYNSMEAVRLLLKRNADPNIKNANGETALMIAAKFLHPTVLVMLLHAGAAINLRNNKNETALTIAHFCGFHTMDGVTIIKRLNDRRAIF